MASSEAPGDLEVLRSLINTVEPEDQMDLLQANGDLAGWFRRNGFGVLDDKEGAARLRAFREALRALLETHAGEGEETERWQALQPFAARSGYYLKVAESGGLALQPQGSGADSAISAVLAIALDAMRAGTWRRLKACRKHSCRWAFYDRSKNGSGAWCSMGVCGNRAKAERRRAREKTL